MSISVCLIIRWTGQPLFSNNIPGSTHSASSGRWCLHVLASLASTSHIARWLDGVVRRSMHSGVWLLQFSRWLVQILQRAKGFPSQKPCCASWMLCIFTLWHNTGTILRPWLSTWRIMWRSVIFRRVFSVDSTPANLDRRSWKPWQGSLLWTHRRNRRVAPLGTILLRLQRIVALMKITCRSSQKLHNILLTNRISTFWRCISWTTSLTRSDSLATSSM